MSDLAFDVFLSHALPDKPWVVKLHDALAGLQLKSFLDKRELKDADNWLVALSDGLKNSRHLAFILSKDSVGRKWPEHEWTAFAAANDLNRVIVVMLDSVDIPTMLQPRQAIDATHRDPDKTARVIAEVIARPEQRDKLSAYPGTLLTYVLSRDADKLVVIHPDGTKRTIDPPWQTEAFHKALFLYPQLARKAAVDDAARAELFAHARTLGNALYDALLGGDEHFRRAMQPDRDRPLIALRSNDDAILSLPWELLHHDDRFLLRDGLVDLTRETATLVGADMLLHEPARAFSLVVNISAPQGQTQLSYEEESYRIVKALLDDVPMTPTELGTLDDFLHVVNEKEPTAVHFSGHGDPGNLIFETDEGGEHKVSIHDLVTKLRQQPRKHLPRFFYLASCYGNDPGSNSPPFMAAPESTAARLHREGIAQIVCYHGPIVDQLSTRAEESLYFALAQGQTTRQAVRAARNALMKPLIDSDVKHRPADGSGEPSPVRGRLPAHDPFPFAWAQLVFYHRGPEHPLGKFDEKAKREIAVALHREEEVFDHDKKQPIETRRKRLKAGFIGRRREQREIRKEIRNGQRIFVFVGLGGLGKSTLAFNILHFLGVKGPDDPLVCTLWCQQAEKATNPAEDLVKQLLVFCRARFGAEWEPITHAVDRQAGEDSADRFTAYFQVLLQNVPRLVVVLDNLESLLVGPKQFADDDAHVLGAWRDESLQRIWQLLDAAAVNTGKLYVVASSRYENADFANETVPLGPMPDADILRMMQWFPALRRLSHAARQRLQRMLAGHPRAVEILDDLLRDALKKWKIRNGEFRLTFPPTEAELKSEWEELIAPALPKVQDRLRTNLLLDQLWDKVFDDRARRMMARMTLMRYPWKLDLMSVLGEPTEDATQAEKTAEFLCQSSLVERVDSTDGRYFSLHPATAEYVRERIQFSTEEEKEVHLRIGTHLEADRKGKDILFHLEAGQHLFAAKQYDRANEILGSASVWLRQHGKVREGLAILEPFLEESVLAALDRKLAGQMLGTVGLAYAALGLVEKAIGFYEQYLVIAREIGDRRGVGNALGNLGLAYAALGQVEKAIGLYEQALAVAREIGDRGGEGSALGSLGSAYADLGQVEMAIGFHEQALAVAREIGDRGGEGADLGNLGLTYADLGQVEKAIDFYEQQLVIVREIGDRRGEGNALGSLGIAYANLRQVEKAIGLYEQALVVAREIGDRRCEGADLGNLGLAYADLGQLEKAIGFYEQQLVIAREIGDRRSEGAGLGNLGIAYNLLGQPDKANAVLSQALAIGQEIKDPRITDFCSRALQKLAGG